MIVKIRLQHAKAAAAKLLTHLLREDSGQDLVEYALILCLVMLGAVASMKSLVATIAVVFAAVGTTLTTAT